MMNSSVPRPPTALSLSLSLSLRASLCARIGPGLLAPVRQAARRAPAFERVSRSWNKDGRGSCRRGAKGGWRESKKKRVPRAGNSKALGKGTARSMDAGANGEKPSSSSSISSTRASKIVCCTASTSKLPACRSGIESYLDANNESISISRRMHSQLETEKRSIAAYRTKIRGENLLTYENRKMF